MSTSDSTIKGKFDEVAGKVKQGVGEAFNDQSMANSGAAQQVKGHAEQAWGSVKEGVSEAKAERKPAAEDQAHDVRQSIISTAQNAKERIQSGIDKLTGKDDV
ncbi:MAG: CsbD family protein [Bryocella sp.]